MATESGGASTHIEELTSTLIKVQEQHRSAQFRNPQRELVRRVRVDGGLITSGARADYVVSHPAISDVIVELKGTDTGRGVEQIRATYLVWQKDKLAGKIIGALIVRSKGVHPKHQANIQRWKAQMEMRHGILLLVETRNREYDFHEFVPRHKHA